VGNTLLITPNINSDRTVTLRLVQENSFISPNAATIPVVTSGQNTANRVQDVKVDVVGTRSVSGTFVAKDDMAIAIGGMIEEVDSDQRGQVPLLGDIPGLGFLFRRQEKTKTRRELVIIIRPHIMSTPADSERLTKDMLQQLAPAALERLVDDGFLPEMPLIPNARPVKKAVPLKKKTVSR
jgi:general secretion pathway protein D